MARCILPQTAIGIIDAMPTHGDDCRQAYTALAITGVIKYIHLYAPYEYIVKMLSWEDIHQVEHRGETRGLSFGLLLMMRTGGGKI